MAEPILISLSSTGQRQTFSLAQLQQLSSEPGTIYTVVDEVSEEAIENLILRRNGNALEIEIEGEVVAQLEEFYAGGMNTTFNVDGSLSVNGPVLSSSPILANGQEVVWSAAEGSVAGAAATATGAAASGLSVTSIALGIGGAGLLAGALSSSSSSSSTPVPDETPADTVAPSVTITDDATGTATGDVTYTFTFSEDVTGFNVDDITVSGGTKGMLSGSGSSYTLVVTPDGNSTVDMTVDVGASVAADAAGNNNTAATQSVQSVDTVAPMVTITDNTTGTATGDVLYTFTFSEAVSGFDLSDVTVANGLKGAFTAVSATEYTLVVTPDANSTADVTVDVVANVAVSAESNGNSAATQSVQSVDTVVPTVAITDNTSGTATGDVTYTFTFSEAVSGFDAAGVTVANGSKGAFTAVSATEYTLVVTPDANSTADITVDIGASVAVDVAGNNNTATIQSVQSVDTIVPTVAITDNTSGIATGDVLYTFTFSEAVSGFDAADVTVANGLKGAFSAVSATEYTLAVTPDANSTANLMVDVAGNVAIDTDGNNNTAATQSVQSVDTVVPTVAITDNTAGTATSDVLYTFTFSEAVSGFDAADVTVANGSKGAFTAVSTTEYTLVVTPDANSTTDVTVDVAGSVATDTAGNDNTAATQSIQNVDTVIPTVTSFSSTTVDGTYNAGGTINITATTSEAIQSGNTLTVTLDTGKSIILTAASAGTSLTGTYTIEAGDNSGDLTVSSFVIDNVQDTTGNTMASTALPATNIADGSDIIIDTPPTVAITLSDTALAQAETATVMFTFSETPIGFTEADVTVENGTLSGFGVTVDDKVYTATFTPTAALSDTTNVISVGTGYTDAATNTGTAGTSENYIIETDTDATIVVFDLTSGLSSDHSNQTFDSGIAYTIYLYTGLAGDSFSLNQLDEVWSGGSNLNSDDTIIYVGLVDDGTVTAFATRALSGGFISWTGSLGKAHLHNSGELVNEGSAHVDLWNGFWQNNPNAGDSFTNVYLTVMPTGVTLPV